MANEIPAGAGCCLEFLTVIAGRKMKDQLSAALSGAGGRLMTVVYGKGSVSSDYLRDMLGLVPEEQKIVITCLLPGSKAADIMGMLTGKFHFDRPNTGIAFTIPIEKISF